MPVPYSVHLEYALRIITGTLFAGLIGFERDSHGRPAGLKTHVIVGLASATFMVVSTQLWDFQHYHTGQNIGLDPSRIAAAVVTGVGFLGGGAILRTGLGVQGLTTAAGLWLVAAIGLCSGGGFYPEAALVTGIGLLALTVLRRFERRNDLHRNLVLCVDDVTTALKVINERFRELSVTAQELGYVRNNGTVELTFDIKFNEEVATQQLIDSLEQLPGLKIISLGQAHLSRKD